MAKGRKMKSNAPLRAWAAPRLLTKLTCGRWPLPYAAARTQLSGNRVGRGNRAQYGGALGRVFVYWKHRSAKRINERRGTAGAPAWQRNDYYEHIIRDDAAL